MESLDAQLSHLDPSSPWYGAFRREVATGAINSDVLDAARRAGKMALKSLMTESLSQRQELVRYTSTQWQTFMDREDSEVMSAPLKAAAARLHTDLTGHLAHDEQWKLLLPFAAQAMEREMNKYSRHQSTYQRLHEFLTRTAGLREQAADTVLGIGILGLHANNVISYNTNLHFLRHDGKRMFLKVHRLGSVPVHTRARMEAMSNYVFGIDPVLRSYVPGTDTSDILDLGDVAISVQNDISSERDMAVLDQLYWIDAYARIACRAEVLTQHIEVQHHAMPSFEEVADEIPSRIAPRLRSLRSHYEDGLHALTGDHVGLADTKADNRLGHRFVDMEYVCKGSLALMPALHLAQMGCDTERINAYSSYYVDRIRVHSGGSIQPDKKSLLSAIRAAIVPLALKEIGGLCSREKTPHTMRQLTQLTTYLGINP